MPELFTRWGSTISTAPLSEYPRPQLRRDSYINLNGVWMYAITKSPVPPEEYEGGILVPFSPESLLSCVRRQVGRSDYIHYMRTFPSPEAGENRRVLLNFGAVDQRAKVFINGFPVGEHAGGYLPFSLDITGALRPGENVLTVTVQDNADDETLAHGRQSYEPGGLWHSTFSGIWQTVWLEVVPEEHITFLTITPDIDAGTVSIAIAGAANGQCRVYSGGVLHASGAIASGECTLSMGDFRLWSTDDPFLYDVELICGEDRIYSYFGMRKFSTVPYRGRYVTALNNRPFFMKGILDQGMWSDSMATPPADDAMISDIETARSLGFNMIHKSAKIEPLRWYYHCDRLGMLVWQDMVPSGGRQDDSLTKAVSRLGMLLKDSHYGIYGRRSREGREQFRRDCLDTCALLKNCVSLCTWVLFSRGRGQFDSMELTQLLWDSDPTRLVDSACGGHDQLGGDFKSRHIYGHRIHLKGDNYRALALSAFGSCGLDVAGHTLCRVPSCKETFGSAEKLSLELEKLFSGQLPPLIIREKLSVCIFTQLSDTEDEVDGLLTTDREVLKIAPDRLRPLLDALEFEE